jgi:hypothetical protein
MLGALFSQDWRAFDLEFLFTIAERLSVYFLHGLKLRRISDLDVALEW